MRKILICATKPTLQPLRIVNELGDAQGEIEKQIELHDAKDQRKLAETGSTRGRKAIQWHSAICIEIEVPLTAISES